MLIFSPVFLAGIFCLNVVVLIIRSIWSPLAKAPGPWTSLFTTWVLKWHELRANRRVYIHGLHLQYGPVVRIAPNEVSFTSPEAVKEVYCSGGSGYDKTEFYDLFKVYGRRTMFTKLHKDDHARRRRIIADRYANSNVMKPNCLAGIEKRADNFIRRCEDSHGGSLDIFICLHSYACDCVTHHLFHPYGTNCLQNNEDEEMMHQVASDDSLTNRLIQYYSPALHKLVGRLLHFFAKPRETPLADEFVLGASRRSDPAPFTLMNRLLQKKSGDLEGVDMSAECLDHMAAGIDTTGDGLCFLMWELSQPRSMPFQKQLQRELLENPDASVDKLAFLEAVTMEGLRCFPPIPMSLPRYVPAGGRVIDGYLMPEGTVVSCQAYSVHLLNPDVFPNPEMFDPTRWLREEGDTERKRLQFAFSTGGRGCVGKHLALAEMKTLLKQVYSRYTTTPDALTDESGMVMSDQLISSRPLSQKCLLRFEAIASEKA